MTDTTTDTATGRLLLSADSVTTASPAQRTITGLVVPYGKAGMTSAGLVEFAAGSLSWVDPRRVKLLREHDQRDVLGYATELTEKPDGLWGTFSVPEGENGDRALTEAVNGLRDAFSVGVQLDDATLVRLRRAQAGVAVKGVGALREVSQVSVPAFDDARIPAAAAAGDLVVSAWATTTAAAAGDPAERTTRLAGEPPAAAPATDPLVDQVEPVEAAPDDTTPDPAGAAGAGDPATTREDSTMTEDNTAGTAGDQGTGSTATAAAETTGPSALPAVAGAAHVTGEPSTYNFDGTSSLVRDAYMGRMAGDGEAAQRVERFNAELRDGNPASVHAFVTAAATRDDLDAVPAIGLDHPRARPDLLREVVDAGRPLASKLTPIPLTNAQPFAIPEVGEFTGVGAHTEGTPHRPAGTLTLSGEVVQPQAMSGAYEVSRELVDSMNPAIDRIAARQMLRDYRRQSEGVLATLLNAVAPTVGGVDGVVALRGAMMDATNDDDEPIDVAWLSKTLGRAIATEVDGVDRLQLPFVGASNAAGTYRAGSMGLNIDGTDLTRSARLDAGTGVLARRDGLLFAESRVLQFRFDEVLGPGVVKLALWAYVGAGILDTDDVVVVQSAPLV